MLVEMCRLMAAGRRAEPHDLFDLRLPLVRYELQPGVGLAVRKYILHKRGVLASDKARKPAARPLARPPARSTALDRLNPAAPQAARRAAS